MENHTSIPHIIDELSSEEDEFHHHQDDECEGSDHSHRPPKQRTKCFKKRRAGYPVLIIYPDDPFSSFWDIYITLILVFSCMTVPYRLALIKEDSTSWKFINWFVDVCFLMDITISFNKASFDENYELITDRKLIAFDYFQGWFIIDIVAIIPFDIILGGSEFNQVVRIARIGRMYKLVKLTRLIRVLKIVKDKSKFLRYIQELFKIGIGLQRFIGSLLAFFILIHIAACCWIMTANLNDENFEDSWMSGDIQSMPPSEQYLTSIYFTVTTITTVGYGDVSGNTKSEKVFCCFVMIIGVMSFSFFSGSLASIIQFYDCQNAKYREQLSLLNKLFKEYKLPVQLYSNLKQSLNYQASNDFEEIHEYT